MIIKMTNQFPSDLTDEERKRVELSMMRGKLDKILDVESVSSDTLKIPQTVSSDTSRQIRYKKKLSRIVLDYRTEDAELIRKEASDQRISITEYIRRALEAYRQIR